VIYGGLIIEAVGAQTMFAQVLPALQKAFVQQG
jgi:hypothetical protein